MNLRIEKRGDGAIVEVQQCRGKSNAREKTARLSARRLGSAETLTYPGVRLAERAGNFIGTVRIEGSDDLTHWRVSADNAALARLSFGGHQVVRNRVELRARKG